MIILRRHRFANIPSPVVMMPRIPVVPTFLVPAGFGSERSNSKMNGARVSHNETYVQHTMTSTDPMTD